MAKRKERKRPSLLLWHWQILKLKWSGKTVCPLMTKEAGRFWPELCLCDIPLTRHRFLAQGKKVCIDKKKCFCLPRTPFGKEASEEVYVHSRR